MPTTPNWTAHVGWVCDCAPMSRRPALQISKPRLGTLYLNPQDQGRPAMAFDNGEEIEVTVNFEHGDPIGRRLVGRSLRWGDDPDYTLHDYSLPTQVWFADPHGIVCFVEPHGRSNTFGVLQEGRLRFTYAIEVGDVGVSYERINAMQSRIEGLEEWIPISCVSHEYAPSTDSSSSSIFTLRRQEPVNISPALNAQIRPTYSFTASTVPGESKFQDEVRITTGVSKARPWHEHLDVHQGVRDLLVVAGWRDYGTWDLSVSRHDDPERALAGNPVGERWARVSTYAVSRASGGDQRSRYLFDFEDVGAAGVRRWFRLRHQHRRGIAGMIHSVGMPGVALETAISEAGAALEHLGYGIAVESEEAPGRRLERHLRRVAEQATCDLAIDLDTWPARFADAYNTVKHPDRPDQWSSLDLSNLLREARLVFRAWVGRRLGVTPDMLERNSSLVPMSRPYERW